MAIFGFGKKKEEFPVTGAPGLPIAQVMAVKQRGMSNEQIIPELERQGYNSSQIFDALNQINISGQGFEQPPPMNSPQQNFPQEQPFAQAQYERPPQEENVSSKDQIEEIAEAIIDEKWKEFEQDVKIIVDWKEKTEAKLNRFEQQILDLTNSLNSLHKSLLSKISAYDRNIMDVGTEMKAMEKVFQKVLPSLTENVNKLDRMTKNKK